MNLVKKTTYFNHGAIVATVWFYESDEE